mmetsp:Transcript_104034/g.324339  ORF Transcript_104034/g.324339 Transcript_104034/m.324339 type:complete len:233 (-) Transcript_104034:229-927(-)
MVRLGELLRDVFEGRPRHQGGRGHDLPPHARAAHEPLPRERPRGDCGGQQQHPDDRPHRFGRHDEAAPQGVQGEARLQQGGGHPAPDPDAHHQELGSGRPEDPAADPLPSVPDPLARLREPAQRQEDHRHPIPLPVRAAHQHAANLAHGPDAHHDRRAHRPQGLGVCLHLRADFRHVLPQLHRQPAREPLRERRQRPASGALPGGDERELADALALELGPHRWCEQPVQDGL